MKTLFPPANRTAALTAFLRTFWQVLHGVGVLSGGTLIYISAAQLQHINLQLALYTAAGVLASALLSGALAAGNILANGLPGAYVAAAAASAIVVPDTTSTPTTPADPEQPAAGVPPATDTTADLALAYAAALPATVPAVTPAPAAAAPTAPPAP